TDLLNVAPKLGPLAKNGGPTPTMALLPDSPAIDAGDNTDAPEWDQRGPGFTRIVNGTIDIGSFGVQGSRDLLHSPSAEHLLAPTTRLDATGNAISDPVVLAEPIPAARPSSPQQPITDEMPRAEAITSPLPLVARRHMAERLFQKFLAAAFVFAPCLD